MKSKNLIIICITFILSVFILVSFKSTSYDVRKITILRLYQSADSDFGNQIIICYPEGKTKKQALLQSKHTNYEINDKMFCQCINEVLANGVQIKSTSSIGDSHLMVTTYIFE
ncbi:MAG TPA: hypothetical protein VNZ49_00160 [Bacteroidia bacterium]|jgi:hypothetical protein|nr:hypothetical protein [Bacteroidia bacterium]